MTEAMQTFDISEDLARKVLGVVDKGLVSGLGHPEPGQMCVEAAVCFALGLPHSDEPPCVGASVRRFKIRLNDARWPSDAARTAGLRKLAIAQLGSHVIDQQAFARHVVREVIRRVLPIALRAAASVNPKHASALEAAAMRCEAEGSREAAAVARKVARTADAASAAAADAASAAADDAASAAADDAASAAADAASAAAAYAASAAAAYAASAAADAASAAADAASAAADAASAAADDAASAAADDAASAAAASAAAAYAADAASDDAASDDARLKVLNLAAEIGLEALIELKSPGCQFLYLAEGGDAHGTEANTLS